VRRWLRMAAAWLLMMGLFACGRGSETIRTLGDFDRIPLKEAPAILRDHQATVRNVPGMTTFYQGGQTYLLLCAGYVQRGGALEVLEVQGPPKSSKEVRLLAVVREGPSADEFPCTLVAVKGPKDLKFRARISVRGEVHELRGTELVYR